VRRFYEDSIDGEFGPNSLQVAHDFEQASIGIANQLGSFDGRSESNIQTLLPTAQTKAREFMKAVQDLARPTLDRECQMFGFAATLSQRF
jgi:hypothetical protein